MECVNDPNWWALVSITCGVFVLGMAIGGLIGAALAYEASRVEIIHPEEGLHEQNR